MRKALSLNDLFSRVQAGEVKELPIILKADVQGSIEPIVNQLEKLSNDQVKVKILHTGTGTIGKNDASLAVASGAIIVGFNVDVDGPARSLAEAEGVDIRTYSVIYRLTEDIEKAMTGMLEPVYKEVVVGVAEVRAIFKIKSIGTDCGLPGARRPDSARRERAREARQRSRARRHRLVAEAPAGRREGNESRFRMRHRRVELSGTPQGRSDRVLHDAEGAVIQVSIMTTRRQQRVAEQVRHELSKLIEHEIDDPRLELITITDVTISPDLHDATVYVSSLQGEAARVKCWPGWKRRADSCAAAWPTRLKLRVCPNLHFHWDKSLETGDRISRLIDQIEEADTPHERRVARSPKHGPSSCACYPTLPCLSSEHLQQASTFLLITHVSPDSDAIGSLLGLTHALRCSAKPSHPSCAMPSAIALTFCPAIPKSSRRPADHSIWSSRSIAAMNCGSGRIWTNLPDPKPFLINIDHHISNTRFGQINWVDPSAASTAEMVLQLIDQLGVPLNQDIATLPAVRHRRRHAGLPHAEHHAATIAIRRTLHGSRRLAYMRASIISSIAARKRWCACGAKRSMP